MKKALIISILILNTIFYSCSQDEYQEFPEYGFKIKCNCNLSENASFNDAIKKQGKTKGGALICSKGSNNDNNVEIYNIVITDVSEIFDQNPKYNSYVSEKLIKEYENNLINSGFKYRRVKFLNSNALEFNYNQNDYPRKAIIFIKNKMHFMLQIGTKNNIDSKFNDFVNSFKSI